MADKESAVDGILKEVDVNVAATLRDIAANCDKTTGRVLRECETAARDGKEHIITKVSVEDRQYLYAREQCNATANLDDNNTWKKQYKKELDKLKITPLVDKLESLGFKLETAPGTNWSNEWVFIKISW